MIEDLEKVLFVAYQFPPMSGPGVNRSLQLARHLPAHGYEPVVLTADERTVRSGDWPCDDLLLKEVEGMHIVRAQTTELRGLRRWLVKLRLYRVAWFLFFPLLWEESALWPFVAYRTALRVIRRENIRLVYTSSAPFSSLLLGALLKNLHGVRWVADLRDPYTDAYAHVWPGKGHWHFSRLMERWVLGMADHVIVNTPEVRKLYVERGLADPERLTYITNGF